MKIKIKSFNRREILEKSVLKLMSDKKLTKLTLSLFKGLNLRTSHPFFMDVNSKTHCNLLNFLNSMNILIKRKVPKINGKYQSEDIEFYVFGLLPSSMSAMNTLYCINQCIHDIEEKYDKKFLFKKIRRQSIIERRNL